MIQSSTLFRDIIMNPQISWNKGIVSLSCFLFLLVIAFQQSSSNGRSTKSAT